jgi:hypothetical protein
MPGAKRGRLILRVSVLAIGLAAFVSVAQPTRAISSQDSGQHSLAALLAGFHMSPILAGSPDGLPADCIPSGSGVGGVQLGVVIEITGGSLTSSVVSVPTITANICGILRVVQGNPGLDQCPANGQITVPADGQKFGTNQPVTTPALPAGSLAADVDVVPGLANKPFVPFFPNPQPIVTNLQCVASNNGLQVTISFTNPETGLSGLTGTAGLFGLDCSETVSPTLTGTLTGAISSGFTLMGTLATKNGFPLKPVLASSTCPSTAANDLDEILGIGPTSAPTANLSLSIAATLYYCNADETNCGPS